MKKSLAAFLSAILIIGSLTGCGGGKEESPQASAGGAEKQESTSANPITITFGHGQSETHSFHKAAIYFKDLLEKESDGAITVDVQGNGSLGDEREMAEGLQMGTIDMEIAAVAALSGFNSTLDVFNLPYLFDSREQAFLVLDGEVGKEVFQGLEDQGIHVLGTLDLGFRSMTNSKRPILTPEDCKGLRMRTLESTVCVDALGQLGIDAVAMSFSELFTSLQTGAVDGQENPISVIYSSRFYEVQKYLSLTEHFYPVLPLMISQKTLDKLSDEQKQMVENCAQETIAYQRKLSMDEMDSMIAGLKENKMEINEVDKAPFIEATKPVYDKYADEYGELVNKIQSVQ